MKQVILLLAVVCLAQLVWSFETEVVPVNVEDPYGGGGGGKMKMGGGKMKMGGGKMKMGGGKMKMGGGKMGGGMMGGGKMGGGGGGPPKMGGGGGAPKMGGGSTGAGPSPVSGSDSRRDALVACGKALYDNRGNEHYTEGGSRWEGISSRIRPPSAPTYSDCSSAVSWCYWTVFGNGPDILNGDSWQGGYTGTMGSHGTAIPCSQMQPGDVALYGSGAPWDHAEMYMGGGQMVSHGADPVSMQSSSSLQGFAQMQCRRYF